jgi:Mrp family chromosome partitioning ATPase
MYGNVAMLRRTFGEELAHYGTIIVDMPSLINPHSGQINGVGVAAACDSVYLVCVADVTTRGEIVQAAEALRSVSAKLVGTIANDVAFATLGSEIAREARRIKRLLPRVSGWIERKALGSVFLNRGGI